MVFFYFLLRHLGLASLMLSCWHLPDTGDTKVPPLSLLSNAQMHHFSLLASLLSSPSICKVWWKACLSSIHIIIHSMSSFPHVPKLSLQGCGCVVRSSRLTQVTVWSSLSPVNKEAGVCTIFVPFWFYFPFFVQSGISPVTSLCSFPL